MADPLEIVRSPGRLTTLELYDVLDSEPEQEFDDVVHLTAHLCATPVALVSLVDRDRQWFKARVGFPPCETDLDSSVCKFTLESPDLLVIEDLTVDGRTRHNALVTGDPHIRFYAGAPLVAPDGEIIGSLCVIDTKPRPGGLSAEQRDDLRILARQTMLRLEARRLAQQRRKTDLQNQALVKIGDRLRDLSDPIIMAEFAAEVMGQTLEASRAGYAALDELDRGSVVIEADWRAAGIASIVGRHAIEHFGDVGSLLRAGTTMSVHDVRTDASTAAAAAAFEALGIRSLLNIPLLEHGRLVALIFVHFDSPRSLTANEIDFVRNVADRARVGIGRVRAEKQQDTLNRELSHRLKNTLAMVQAIAGQTLKRVTEREAVQTFDQRLQALSSAHDILLKGQWASADIAGVVDAALANLGESSRCDRVGPTILIGPKATLSTSLLVHELATNAMKYGSLSRSNGRVKVGWGIRVHPDRPELFLSWSEHGGPSAEPPTKKGFGSRLLNLGLIGTGGAELSYTSTGFEAEFTAPLSQAQEAE